MIRLTIPGHAKPSVRITARTKWTDQAQAYLAWQGFVASASLQVRPRPLPWEHVRLDMLFFFCDDRHGDRVNLAKALEDGLVWGGLFMPRRLKSGKRAKKADDSCIRAGLIEVCDCATPADERVELTISEYVREAHL